MGVDVGILQCKFILWMSLALHSVATCPCRVLRNEEALQRCRKSEYPNFQRQTGKQANSLSFVHTSFYQFVLVMSLYSIEYIS